MSTATVLYDTDTDDLTLDPVAQAIADIAAGRPIVVVDDENRENEGDLVVAAEKITPEIVAFMMSECRGLICAPMEGPDLDRLKLPQMVEDNTEQMKTAFTVSVDASAAHGVTTGISASDRATTLRLLAQGTGDSQESGQVQADDFVRPGHVFPLRARPGGVLVRNGHTEAAVDLARLAGLRPAGAIVEIAGEDGRMLRLPELIPFARKHGLTIISIEDLVEYRRARELAETTGLTSVGFSELNTLTPAPEKTPLVHREAETPLPTPHGTFTAYGYRAADGIEHIALVHGEIGDGQDVLVRLHSECLTGDVFGSRRCDCGPQLDASLKRVQEEGRGVVVYLRGHEGRGIGLLPKLRAYELQEQGHDTLDANLELGLPADARDYGAGARILTDLGVRTVRLMTNNPEKTAALARYGLTVSGREPAPVQAGEHNIRYLRAKRDRMGHDLPWLEAAGGDQKATGGEK
ncbi:bifunctional 3,4-dihydroxy-2-butanone-4-phosphate synthase/GTP cyclohydrolase II [Streptomyces acidiscabies]|uniref:Riboflavin biosynthesis protein RibBA n=1 Tax=Streptomyces acidiscabies TaxID=42234 RepID=A0AAP6B843_9ACTN|nr:bifunctional 3,4-dihydroxy-2-butanone-4-phosphate synthase/GTP cyclohydrolase II [Streptomyces acidiscabies]MBZ3912130.1 bifunctional 3,4-dihydroxy-2-butanone-4-phosphate synthase/GTP cyclohydrolase II [Streptomyces acidiscabies]MDX2959939.1 bifunctional 3,4-dihydroxy-2-butanone-4-phosphate synthase/GTP cyclohydrolase II [Streptomyces acidiscabies]MDX3024146.1 bifunctional 3,4-dihydroxy-2-butanone-4-phosphate synthase/GTP cyclohydrolase II [Streptomyces acidiscabies]MDX3794569.1 bifunctional